MTVTYREITTWFKGRKTIVKRSDILPPQGTIWTSEFGETLNNVFNMEVDQKVKADVISMAITLFCILTTLERRAYHLCKRIGPSTEL